MIVLNALLVVMELIVNMKWINYKTQMKLEMWFGDGGS